MSEGKVLFCVLSLILYSKEYLFCLRASRTAEFSYYPDRILTWDSLHPHNPEKMEPAHPGVAAKRHFLFCRQDHGYPSVL